MNVILLEKVHNLGELGEQVSVKSGYGRNFLIPQGKAIPASAENVAQLEARRAELEKAAAEKAAAEKAAAERERCWPRWLRRESPAQWIGLFPSGSRESRSPWAPPHAHWRPRWRRL